MIPGVVRTPAFLACILYGALAGCAKPTTAVYQGGWDGQATQWEVPPSRLVTGADGGVGAGGDPGLPGGSSGNLPVCTRDGQGHCCYEDKPGRPSGFPKCTWQRLSMGESTVITTAFKKDEKVTLPVTVTLTGMTPATFASYEECVDAPIGFTLTGPGMEEGRLGGNINHYTLKTDGTWSGGGGGGQSGLVAGRNTLITSRDGAPPPSPGYTLHDGLCAPLKMADVTATIHVFDQIDFEIDGVEYQANFRNHPNGNVTAYYVLITKGF
jgi:hypothetical protein